MNPSLRASLASFGFFCTTFASYGAISMAYDTGASNPSSNSYVYNGSDSLGSPFVLNMSVSGWDDSTGMTTTPTFTPASNGGVFRGTLNTDIDPGDYVCFHFDLTDPSGNPIVLGVHDSGQPYYDSTQPNRWLANSLRYFGTDAQDAEDYAFIYSPDGGNLIHDPANGTIVVGTDQQTGMFASGSTTMSGVSIPDTASSTYAGIEALTGTGNNSYIDFNLTGGGGTPISVALAGDGPGSGPMPSAARMGGYTWHFGNTGVNTFDSATEFGFTLDGVVDTEIVVGVPEPSRSVLLGLTALALLARRKR